jgi:hypothetical protein
MLSRYRLSAIKNTRNRAGAVGGTGQAFDWELNQLADRLAELAAL